MKKKEKSSNFNLVFKGPHQRQVSKEAIRLLAELFGTAGYGGKITLVPGKRIKGSPHTQGVTFKPYVPQGNGPGSIEIAVQPEGNDSRYPFTLSVPRGVDFGYSLGCLKEAARRIETIVSRKSRTLTVGDGITKPAPPPIVVQPKEESVVEREAPPEATREEEEPFVGTLKGFFEDQPSRVRVALQAIRGLFDVFSPVEEGSTSGKEATEAIGKALNLEKRRIHTKRWLLGRLAQFGYIEKVRIEGVFLYRITAVGKAILDGAEPDFGLVRKRVSASLGRERHTLRFGEKLTAKLSEIQEIVSAGESAAQLLKSMRKRQETLKARFDRLAAQTEAARGELAELEKQIKQSESLIERARSSQEKLARVSETLRSG